MFYNKIHVFWLKIWNLFFSETALLKKLTRECTSGKSKFYVFRVGSDILQRKLCILESYMEFIFQKKHLLKNVHQRPYFRFIVLLCFGCWCWRFSKKNDDVSLRYTIPKILFYKFRKFLFSLPGSQNCDFSGLYSWITTEFTSYLCGQNTKFSVTTFLDKISWQTYFWVSENLRFTWVFIFYSGGYYGYFEAFVAQMCVFISKDIFLSTMDYRMYETNIQTWTSFLDIYHTLLSWGWWKKK